MVYDSHLFSQIALLAQQAYYAYPVTSSQGVPIEKHRQFIECLYPDTAFMFIIAGLILTKVFQNRHPDIHTNAFIAFFSFAVVIFFTLLGIVSDGHIVQSLTHDMGMLSLIPRTALWPEEPSGSSLLSAGHNSFHCGWILYFLLLLSSLETMCVWTNTFRIFTLWSVISVHKMFLLLPSMLAWGNYSGLYSRDMRTYVRTYVSSRLRMSISHS